MLLRPVDTWARSCRASRSGCPAPPSAGSKCSQCPSACVNSLPVWVPSTKTGSSVHGQRANLEPHSPRLLPAPFFAGHTQTPGSALRPTQPESCLLSCLWDVFSPAGRRGIHPVPQEEIDSGRTETTVPFGHCPQVHIMLRNADCGRNTPQGKSRVLGPWTLSGRQHSGSFSGPGASPKDSSPQSVCRGGHPVRSHSVVQEPRSGPWATEQ